MIVCCKVEGSAGERSEDVESFLTSQGLITDSQDVNKDKDLTEAADKSAGERHPRNLRSLAEVSRAKLEDDIGYLIVLDVQVSRARLHVVPLMIIVADFMTTVRKSCTNKTFTGEYELDVRLFIPDRMSEQRQKVEAAVLCLQIICKMYSLIKAHLNKLNKTCKIRTS